MAGSLLDQLDAMTVAVCDTGDLIQRFRPRDATTDPSLITAAAQMPEYADVVDGALRWAEDRAGGDAGMVVGLALDRLAVEFGLRILELVPGRVSTEVDARLSYDTRATVEPRASSPTSRRRPARSRASSIRRRPRRWTSRGIRSTRPRSTRVHAAHRMAKEKLDEGIADFSKAILALERVLEERHAAGKAGRSARAFFQIYDLDGDGHITRGEWGGSDAVFAALDARRRRPDHARGDGGRPRRRIRAGPDAAGLTRPRADAVCVTDQRGAVAQPRRGRAALARPTPRKEAWMPLTYRSAKLFPSTSHSFDFGQTVEAYAVGIASFLFTYGDDDHHVKELGLEITSNLSTSKSQVDVHVNGVLTDGEGHFMTDGSYVTVVVFAWVGSPTSNTILSGPYTIGSGEHSNPINLPGSSAGILQGSMAGFLLSYEADHHVEGVNACIGVSQDKSQATLTAKANMWDSNGDKAQNPTATGNLLASTDASPGFIVQTYTAQSSAQQTIRMSQPVRAAFSLITSFQVQYDTDHHVQTIGAGPDATSVDGTDSQQVITSGVWAFMNDDSGNNQDNDLSSCTILVIGIL